MALSLAQTTLSATRPMPAEVSPGQPDVRAMPFEGGAETLNSAFRRLVFHEKFRVEQGCFDLADVF